MTDPTARELREQAFIDKQNESRGMGPKEQATINRIAKHNGVTPEQVMSDAGKALPTAQPIADVPPGSNPFTAGLNAILAVGYVVGLVLVIVGASQNASYNEYLDGAVNPMKGLATLVWAGAFLNLAILATFARLTVSAVRWDSKH